MKITKTVQQLFKKKSRSDQRGGRSHPPPP